MWLRVASRGLACCRLAVVLRQLSLGGMRTAGLACLCDMVLAACLSHLILGAVPWGRWGPWQTSAWNAVITGRKKWIMWPPHYHPPGVWPRSAVAPACM